MKLFLGNFTHQYCCYLWYSLSQLNRSMVLLSKSIKILVFVENHLFGSFEIIKLKPLAYTQTTVEYELGLSDVRFNNFSLNCIEAKAKFVSFFKKDLVNTLDFESYLNWTMTAILYFVTLRGLMRSTALIFQN